MEKNKNACALNVHRQRDYSWANANRFICQSDEKLVAQVLKRQNKAAPFSSRFIDPGGHCRRVTN
jgi:hypothetical protein